MATTVGEVQLDLKLNKKPYEQGMASVNQSAGGVAGAIGRKIAGGLSLAALVKFGKDCIYAGSKLNAMRSLATQAFPTMNAQVQTFATKAAGAFGLSEKMALQYAGTMGAMAKGFGFSEQQAMKLGTTLTGLAGDVASFYSMSQDEAYTKLQSVFTGETESLKSLGIVMSQNALDSYAMANGYSTTTANMSEQEKVMLRYNFVLSQLSLAQGDFQRTQSAWGNQVKILQLHFQDLQAQLGQGFIMALAPVLRYLNAFMEKLVLGAKYFRAFVAYLTGNDVKKKSVSTGKSFYNLGNSANAATPAVSDFSNALKNTDTSAKKSTKSTKKAAKAAKKAMRDLMGFDRMNKLSAKESAKASKTPKTTTPKTKTPKSGAGGAGAGAFTGNVPGLDESLFGDDTQIKLGKKGKKVADIIKKVFGIIWKIITGVALFPVKLFLWTGKIIWKAIQVAWKGIKKFAGWVAKIFKKVVGKIKEFFSKLAEKIVGVFKKVGGKIKEFAGVVKDKIVGAFKKAGEWIKKAAGRVKTFGDNLKKATAKKLRQGLEKVKEAAGKLKDAWGAIKTKTVELTAKLKDEASEAWSALKDKFSDLKDTVVNFIAKLKDEASDAWDNIKGKISSTTATVTAKLEDLFSDVWATIKDGWNAVTDKVGTATAALSDGFKKGWDKISAGWTAIKNKTGTATAKIVDKFKKGWDKIKDGWGKIKNKVGEAKATLSDKFSKGWGSLKKGWANFKKKSKAFKTLKFTATLKGGAAKAMNAVRKAWSRLKGGTKTFAVKFKNFFTSIWDSLARKINRLRRRSKIARAIIRSDLPVTSGPAYAEGGWLKKNTPHLAWVGDNKHEAEAVAPESKLQSMANSAAQQAAGAGNAQTVALLQSILSAIVSMDTGVYLDGKEIAKSTIKNINQQTRTTGRSPILL